MLLPLLELTATQATAGFLDAWRSLNARRVWLIQIDVTDPTPQTLRFTSAPYGCFTPDGVFWQGRIRQFSPIYDRGSFLSPGPNLSSFDFTLDNAAIAECTGTEKLANLLARVTFRHATVQLWMWERSLTSFADAYRRFVGVIDRHPVSAEEQSVRFFVLQDRSWNLALPTKRITKGRYSNIPDSSDGAFEPIVRGDWRTMPMRPPWASNFLLKTAHETMGGSEPKLPTVIIDRGSGTDPLKVLIAGHRLSLLNSIFGANAQIRNGGQFDSIITGLVLNSFIAADGSGYLLADESLRAYAPIVPIDVRVTGSNFNTALNPKNAFDPLDEQTFATVDFDAGQGRLQLLLPNLSSLGDIQTVEVVLLYSTSLGGAPCSMRPINPSGGALGAAVTIPASTTPDAVSGTWDAAGPGTWWSRSWEFGGTATHAQIDLLITGPSVQALFVYGVALRVYHRPSLTLLQYAERPGLQGMLDRLFQRGPLPPVYAPARPGLAGIMGPVLVPGSMGVPGGHYELRSPIMANTMGPLDESDGRWTGLALGLIERPTDIARELLCTAGGLDRDADFEMNSGALGSFLDARTTLKTMEGSDYTASFYINRPEKLASLIGRFGNETLCEFELDPATNRWHCLPWVRQPAVTFRTLYRDDLEALSVDVLSDTHIAQGVKLDYAHSPGSNRHLFSAVVDEETSEMGFLAGTHNDQQLTVTAANNTLRFTPNGSTMRTAAMSATVSYEDGIDLAEDLQAKMRAVDASTWCVGFGTAIKLDYNDQITVIVSSVTYVATLRPYEYTPDNLAREAQSALNAAGTGVTWTVTYSHSTRKFTITATGAFTLVLTHVTRQALAVLGFTLGTNIVDSSSPFTQTAAASRNQEHIWISTTNAAGTLEFGDVLTTCKELIGALDTADATVGQWMAGRRRGGRQARAAASIEFYGKKDPIDRQLATIRVWNVAGDLRDRLFDFHQRSPAEVTLVSRTIPDIKRGDTFQLDATSIDPWAPYTVHGTTGSHSGRVYRVVEVVQHGGPNDFSAHITAYEMDAPAPAPEPTGIGWGWRWGEYWGGAA